MDSKCIIRTISTQAKMRDRLHVFKSAYTVSKYSVNSAFFYDWCWCASVIFMKKDVSVLSRKIQLLAKTQCLGQPRTLTRRSGRHMPLLDKAPPISTQYSKSGVEVKARISSRRGQLDCIYSSQTHRRASRYQRGHRDARLEMPGGNLAINILFSLVLFENNRW